MTGRPKRPRDTNQLAKLVDQRVLQLKGLGRRRLLNQPLGLERALQLRLCIRDRVFVGSGLIQ
jgi:hypothetical protein